MESEYSRESIPLKERLFSTDRVVILFAHLPQERIDFQRKVFLHGAFRDLCREFPEFFADLNFGKPGGWVESEEFNYGFNNLMLSGLISYDGSLRSLRVDTESLQEYALSLEAALERADAPRLSRWGEVGERFAELIESNKLKNPSELLVS